MGPPQGHHYVVGTAEQPSSSISRDYNWQLLAHTHPIDSVNDHGGDGVGTSLLIVSRATNHARLLLIQIRHTRAGTCESYN